MVRPIELGDDDSSTTNLTCDDFQSEEPEIPNRLFVLLRQFSRLQCRHEMFGNDASKGARPLRTVAINF